MNEPRLTSVSTPEKFFQAGYEYMKNLKEQNKIIENPHNYAPTDVVFVRRLSDGKFYRGARWWRWTRSWRRAAALPIQFWEDFIAYRIEKDTEFVGLNEVNT